MTSSDEEKLQLFQFSERRQTISICLLLLALVWLAFAPALKNNFVTYDDDAYVTANPHVQQGLTWSNVKWAFQTTAAANWHPLTWLSCMLDCQIYGLKPRGHHLTNLLLHTANTILLFLVFRRMTGALWRSFFVAALFGLHPLHVESVAWVSERKDVLSALFWMLTLWAYVKFAEESKLPEGKSKLFYGLALGFFALGLMAKPMLVTLPFILLLLDWWPLERFQLQSSGVKIQNLILEKLPFFLLAAASSIVTFVVQNNADVVTSFVHLPLAERIENALVSYVRYLAKLFWPVNLAAYYPYPQHQPMAMVLVAALLLCGITVFVFTMRRERPYLLTGWLWFVGTLVPVIGLVQVGCQSMADRYSYIPLIGIFMLLAWGAWDVLKYRPRHAIAVFTVAAVIIFLCVVFTRRQIGYWADGETLFRHAIAVTEDNYRTHYYLASTLNDKGLVDEAIQEFEKAIKMNPNDADVHENLGVALTNKGLFDEAIRQFGEALRLDPNVANTHCNLGITLRKEGFLDEAMAQFKEAIRLNPNASNAHDNLGIALEKKGLLDDAIDQYLEAIRKDPYSADAYNNLGVALSRKGRLDEAIGQLQEALRLQPASADIHYNLGNALVRKGRLAEAIGHFEETTKLQPNDAGSHNNLGVALFRVRRLDEAINQFEQAIKLDPDDVSARSNLAAALNVKAISTAGRPNNSARP